MNLITAYKKLKELENENKKLTADNKNLKALCDLLEQNNNELRELGADPVGHALKLEEELDAKYRAAAASCERALEDVQRQINKARSEGYKEAFAKMGMFALDKRLEGRRLYYDPETLEAVELISEEELKTIEAGEIEIEDLIDEEERA